MTTHNKAKYASGGTTANSGETQTKGMKELRQSEARFRWIFECSPMDMALIGLDGKFLDINPAALRLHGYDHKEELIGKDCLQLVAPEYHQTVKENWDRVLRHGEVREVELVELRKDGRRINTLVTASKLSDSAGEPFALLALVQDITARKQAEEKEEALRQSEELRRAITENSRDAIYVKDRNSRWLLANPALLRIVGKPLEEVLGKTDAEIYPDPRVGAAILANDTRIMERGEPEAFEETAQTPEGVRVFLSTKAPRFDSEGKVIGLAGISRDITDRKQMEETLRTSEQLYRAIGESIDYGIWICDPQGRNTYASESLLKLVGITQEQCKDFGWGDVLHPDDAEATVAAWKECVRTGGPWYREHRYRGVDGQWHPILACGVPVRDERGEITRWAGINLDISRLKQTEAALRQSEQQFRALADSIPNLAWWADPDGYITWYNRRWYEYTGTTAEQMEGWGWQSVHDPAMLPEVLERWKASLASGHPFEMEFPLRGADGRFRWFLTRVTPVRDAAGQVMRWFGTNTDVSDIRDAREVLARSKEELERLVTERTGRLQELVGELEHFSYTITHDMRSPLRAMKGFGEIVCFMCQDCEKKEPQEFLRRITTSADRMDRLITDALNYSRSVRQELPLEDVNLAQLLRGMLDTYPEFQPAKAHIKIEGSLPVVVGNEAGLTQCFSNLLGNAVKFVSPGMMPEVRVWAEWLSPDPQHDQVAELSIPRSGSVFAPAITPSVRIWVEDQGIGISREMLPRVFDMFTRGSKNYDGTGIGLALVRKVTHRMGGKVGVESEEGKGSRFWLELKAGGG